MDGCEALLDYLRDKIHGYTFEEKIDRLFVNELLENFPDFTSGFLTLGMTG